MRKIHSILGDDKIYNTKTIHFQFLVRVFGVIVAILLIGLSEYPLNVPVFYTTAIVFTLYSFYVRFSVKLHENIVFQKFNLYIDVLVLSFLVALRGGLRSDFFLGYYLILGYVLLLRDRNLLFRISLWIVANFVVVAFIFTSEGEFSLGRLIIRLVLIIGTMYLLSNYSKMLLEEESLKIRAAQLAVKDGLTNLYNRHILTHLDELLNQETGSHFIVLIDIDDFKIVNDTYGHRYGDEVLIKLAEIFNKQLTSGDLSLRYGGEEFLLILNSTNLQVAIKLLESILFEFTNVKYPWYKLDKFITFSAGIVEKLDSETIEESIEKSDKLLYKAKSEGKNKILSNNAPH